VVFEELLGLGAGAALGLEASAGVQRVRRPRVVAERELAVGRERALRIVGLEAIGGLVRALARGLGRGGGWRECWHLGPRRRVRGARCGTAPGPPRTAARRRGAA